MTDFDRFAALSFDCYGTLIDWESGIRVALRPWAERHGLDVGDDQLLADFAAIESVVEQERPAMRYPDVLAETLARIAEAHGVESTAEERTGFGASVPAWPPFEDSVGALARLQRRFRLIVLSNVDRASFAASAGRLDLRADLVLTAEDLGSYKPDPANFAALLGAIGSIGVSPDELCHVAQSLYHDHVPALAAGLPTVWIDRRAGRPGSGATPPPTAYVSPTWRFTSMAELADAAVPADS